MNRALETLMKNRYVLLLLLAGTALLLLPAGGAAARRLAATEEERRLEAVLSAVEGVGEVGALLFGQRRGRRLRGAGSAAVRCA